MNQSRALNLVTQSSRNTDITLVYSTSYFEFTLTTVGRVSWDGVSRRMRCCDVCSREIGLSLPELHTFDRSHLSKQRSRLRSKPQEAFLENLDRCFFATSPEDGLIKLPHVYLLIRYSAENLVHTSDSVGRFGNGSVHDIFYSNRRRLTVYYRTSRNNIDKWKWRLTSGI